jgi:hypothetical protein
MQRQMLSYDSSGWKWWHSTHHRRQLRIVIRCGLATWNADCVPRLNELSRMFLEQSNLQPITQPLDAEPISNPGFDVITNPLS